jgi:4-methyl-5(b-hydroxyethyl)-thiazole monophosphate biosynthesis
MTCAVLVPLAPGFEEIEAVAIIDVLRRAGAEVCVASVGERTGDDSVITGAHQVAVHTDASIVACRDRNYDMIVLPGGMPGASNLAQSSELADILSRHHVAGRRIGAICAAPAVVLKALDILPRKEGKMSCYPSFRDGLDEKHRTEQMVSVAGTIITGAGPGAALPFALELVRALERDGVVACGVADSLAKGMLVEMPHD